jgi:hypothetical protein
MPAFRRGPAPEPGRGEVAEWLKAHAWNACIGETLSRVRIPLSPPLRQPIRLCSGVLFLKARNTRGYCRPNSSCCPQFPLLRGPVPARCRPASPRVRDPVEFPCKQEALLFDGQDRCDRHAADRPHGRAARRAFRRLKMDGEVQGGAMPAGCRALRRAATAAFVAPWSPRPGPRFSGLKGLTARPPAPWRRPRRPLRTSQSRKICCLPRERSAGPSGTLETAPRRATARTSCSPS